MKSRPMWATILANSCEMVNVAVLSRAGSGAY
jgi:hypothetical protein